MRFTSAVAFAAAAAPLAVSAKGRLGFSLGVRNFDGSCKSQSDFEQDFAVLKETGVKIFRTYASVDQPDKWLPKCYVPAAVLPAARTAQVQVILGLWAGDEGLYQEEKALVLNSAEEFKENIYAFTVGSEGLYRKYEQDVKTGKDTGYTADYILSKINDFKDAVKSLDKKVGTADSWNKFDDGTANPIIEGGVNFLLVNAFAYWQGKAIEDATDTYLTDLAQAYAKIQSVAGSTSSIELWNGETGWPTDGGSVYDGVAKASTVNAQTYFKESVCAAIDWNFNVFYFSAFAEPWKPNSDGKNGVPADEKHWGAFDANRQQVIPDLTCSYSGHAAKLRSNA